MKLINISVCIFSVAIIVGCAQPLVQPETLQLQHKILTAKHWRNFADRIVYSLVGKPEAGGTAKPTKVYFQSNRPIHIRPAAPDMVFSDTFKMYLTQSLFERGIKVSKTPVNADILSFRVQRFLHDNRTDLRYPFNKFTFWTTLGALGWGRAEFGQDSESISIAGLAASGPILDFLQSLGSVTNAEVVITAFIENNDTIEYMYTEEFYVRPKEVMPNGVYWTEFPVIPLGEQRSVLAGPQQLSIIPVVGH